MKWKTRDGREIEVADMDSPHLTNALHMMQRMMRKRLLATSLAAIQYASTAPDGAAMAAEAESDDMFDAAFNPAKCFAYLVRENPIAQEMYQELKRRKEGFIKESWR